MRNQRVGVLRGPLQFDDGKMPAPIEELNGKVKSSCAMGLILGRPPWPGFPPGRGACRLTAMDLEWCQAVQGLMRTMLVVPGHVVRQLQSHRVDAEWHENLASALRLHRSNEPLDHRDAALLADRAEPGSDAPLATPAASPPRA